MHRRGFPSGPTFKTPHLYCRGHRFDPRGVEGGAGRGGVELRSHKSLQWDKTKEK